MNHIVRDVVNKLVGREIKPVWDSIQSLREEMAELRNRADSYRGELRALQDTAEEVRENLNHHNHALEAHAANLKNNNHALEAYGQNLKNNNHTLEAYGQNLENNNKALEAVSCNLKNNNDALEAYGQNLKNNNDALAAYEKDQKNSRLLLDRLPAFYDLAERLDSQVDMLDLKVSRLGKKQQLTQTAQQADEAMPSTDSTYEGIDYFDFENHFRGSREHVKRVQKMYLPYFTGCKNVADLGCGRGEFLELLLEHKIHAVGVDCYEEFAAYCVKKGLEAKCMDALKYLESIDETDGIFAAQLVEHLKASQVIRLCRLAYEKLKKGCYVVFETPNPMSLAIYTNSFYIDPSHEKPVHPQTLAYFMQKAGFSDIQVIYTQSSEVGIQIPKITTDQNEEAFNAAMEQVQNTLFGSQDYALVARK